MREKIRNSSKRFWALTLVLVMFLTNILGAVEVNAQTSVPKLTIDPVSVGDTKITGGGLVGTGQRKKLNKFCTIYIFVENKEGKTIESKRFNIGPDGGSTWKVTLNNTVKAGDKIRVY